MYNYINRKEGNFSLKLRKSLEKLKSFLFKVLSKTNFVLYTFSKTPTHLLLVKKLITEKQITYYYEINSFP